MGRVPFSSLVVAVGTLVGIGSWSAAAQANPGFPGKITETLELPCMPQCTLCHTRPEGGPSFDRLTTSNGLPSFPQQLFMVLPRLVDPLTGMGNLELDPNDENSLPPILRALRTLNPQLDTDGDTIPDLQELEQLTDPNDPTPNAPLACVYDTPKYGCVGSHVARATELDDVAAASSALMVLAGVALIRRRRAKQR